MSGKELVLMEMLPGDLGIEKRFNSIVISFPSEEEAEKFFIAFTEADRKVSSVSIHFHKKGERT